MKRRKQELIRKHEEKDGMGGGAGNWESNEAVCILQNPITGEMKCYALNICVPPPKFICQNPNP